MNREKSTKKLIKVASFLLAMCIGNINIPVAAQGNSTSRAEDDNRIAVSFTAGQNGVYGYDEKTDSMQYIPPEEYDAQQPPSDDKVSYEQEVDDELIDILSSAAANGVYEPVYSPSGVEASACLIGSRFKTGNDRTYVKVGTGWLINNTYVVTAGHCLYDPEYINNGSNGYALHVAVYVGASNGTSKQYRLGHVKYVGGDFKKYADDTNYQSKGMYDDWGVVKLDSAITVNVSKLKLRVVNGYNDMKGKNYTTVGYPYKIGVNQNISENWNTYMMYRVRGSFYQELSPPASISNADPNYIGLVASSDLKVQQGQSGSPVYTTENGIAYAEGIVVCTYNNVPCVLYINNWLYTCLNGLL